MKSFTSIIGWLLLAALIAIPAFLFYNWYSKAKATEAATASQQGVPAGPIFAGADKSSGADSPSDKAPRPGSWAQPPRPAGSPAPAAPAQPAETAVSKISPVTTRTPASQGSPAPVARTSAAAPVATPPAAPPLAPASQGDGTQSGPITDEKAPAAVPVSSAEAAGALAAPKTEGLAPGQSKTVSYFNPKVERDPTLSPDDYQKIKDEEQQRQDRMRQARLADIKKKKVEGPEAKLKLQGIVGNRVIINGESYAVGNTVMGAKILKIGGDYIIGEFKGKKFKKILQ